MRILVPHDKVLSTLRTIARTNFWQTIYNQSKDLGLNLFRNQNDYTYLQVLLIQELGFYSAINMDIATGEIKEFVSKDDIYCEAYMVYKNSKRKDTKQEQVLPQPPDKGNKYKSTEVVNQNKWNFTSRKGIK
jgi:hypothetical protein